MKPVTIPVDRHTYFLPLRIGTIITIRDLPLDFREAEVERIVRFLRTLVKPGHRTRREWAQVQKERP